MAPATQAFFLSLRGLAFAHAAETPPFHTDVRLRITRELSESVDGIGLDRFAVGEVYEISTTLACYLLAIGGAEPVDDQTPVSILPTSQRLFGNDVGGLADVLPREKAASRSRKKRSGST